MRGRLIVVVAAGALSACAAGNCDPSQAGFFSGIGCEASGGYDLRHQAQQASLAQGQANALQQRASAAQSQDAAAEAQGTLAQRQQRLQAMRSQNAALQRRLLALRGDHRVDQGRLASAQAELNALRERQARVGSAPDEAHVRDVERQQQNLLAIVKGMSDL